MFFKKSHQNRVKNFFQLTAFFLSWIVTNIFTMGGWHAVFPVGAAFLFSFVHGAFASNLLAVLGLEAHK
ncbi:MAG: hypothetical protein AUK28_09735 [Desulfobacterales bacterium CG2_30_60_27]|nr:MAG: hypothetical protein AUK28_09735 [Desulfobacterales bacterium CG2_30_60_27]